MTEQMDMLLNLVSDGNVTPLKQYMEENKEDVSKILSTKPDPLVLAVTKGKSAITKLLLESKAKIFEKAVTACFCKTWENQFEFDGQNQFQLLLQYVDRNVVYENDNTLLHLCVDSGDQKAVRMFCKCGDYQWLQDRKNRFHETPLFMAVRHRSSDIVRYLLTVGADIHTRDVEGNSQLHISDVNMCDLLLKHKADVNAQNLDGEGPLMHALGHNDVPRVNSLLKSNADVNIQRKDGSSLQCLTCENSYYAGEGMNVPCAEALLSAKADVHGGCKNPLAIALNQPEMLHCLLRNGAQPMQEDNTDLQDALPSVEHTISVLSQLYHNLDITHKDVKKENKTILHKYMEEGILESSLETILEGYREYQELEESAATATFPRDHMLSMIEGMMEEEEYDEDEDGYYWPQPWDSDGQQLYGGYGHYRLFD